MITVYASKHTSCPINLNILKNTLKNELNDYSKKTDYLVGVALVDKKTALHIAKTYLGKNEKVHNVLTFTDDEKKGKFVNHRKKLKYLGEVVLCWDVIKEEAKNLHIRQDLRVIELVKHSALHLIGIHHK